MKGFRTRTAVVLVNLGTPAELTASSVRRFLRQFLGDRRVVEIPRPVWWLILNLFVLPLRPRKVVETYREVWTDAGSPLRVITEQQVERLQERFDQEMGDTSPLICHAMTYGEPAIAKVLDSLQQQGIRRIVILPMYPQYSGSTTAAVTDQVADYMKSCRYVPSINLIGSYFWEQPYIEALAQSIREFWQQHGKGEKLLFSYHGIPQSYADKGDPYPGHCECTTGATVASLGLTENDYEMSYQSRFGKAEWVKPYTAERVEQLAKEGVKKLDVVCPAFAADCIETLEEISMENGEIFEEAGGEELRLIPCLNASQAHIDALFGILRLHVLSQQSGTDRS